MFGMGWGEMVVVGVVALIVVGPQELPGLFRTVGQFVGKAKGMAREFSRAMDQAADQAGVKEINKSLQAAANPTKFGKDAINNAIKNPTLGTLSEERQAAKDKMDAAMAKAATERKAREAAEAEAALDEAEADMAEMRSAATAPVAEEPKTEAKE